MIETKEQKRLRKGWSKEINTEEPALVPTPSADNKITVICVKFGTRYGREYVERLRNMVSRHLTVPYEFVCLTDDQHPIEGVRSIVQPNERYLKGWWHKVHMFDPSLPLSGRVLYFDLDVVIHANIDKLVSYLPGQFIGIHDFNRQFHSSWNSLNSSAMLWTHGSQSNIWTDFKKNPSDAMKLPGDQDWIWKLCKGHMKFWPKEWIQSYKWEIRSKEELTVINGKRQFKKEDHSVEPHSDCCVTVFHGDPKPQDVTDKFVVDNWC
jgi:hypothetical protein